MLVHEGFKKFQFSKAIPETHSEQGYQRNCGTAPEQTKNAWYQCYFNIVGEILPCFVRYEKPRNTYLKRNFFFKFTYIEKYISISTLKIPTEPSVIIRL